MDSAVYYKDDGRVVVKVDVGMDPSLTIKEAHATAVRLRKLIESSLPGIAEVDVDLELDENKDDESPDYDQEVTDKDGIVQEFLKKEKR